MGNTCERCRRRRSARVALVGLSPIPGSESECDPRALNFISKSGLQEAFYCDVRLPNAYALYGPKHSRSRDNEYERHRYQYTQRYGQEESDAWLDNQKVEDCLIRSLVRELKELTKSGVGEHGYQRSIALP